MLNFTMGQERLPIKFLHSTVGTEMVVPARVGIVIGTTKPTSGLSQGLTGSYVSGCHPHKRQDSMVRSRTLYWALRISYHSGRMCPYPYEKTTHGWKIIHSSQLKSCDLNNSLTLVIINIHLKLGFEAVLFSLILKVTSHQPIIK